MWTRIKQARLSEGLLPVSVLLFSLISELRVPGWGPVCSTDLGSVHQVVPEGSNFIYNKSSNFLFIGGVPKSGTTLLRVLLDVHPSLQCGPETHIFIDVLKLRYEWTNFQHLVKRNKAAGITQQLIDSSVSSFLLEVIAGRGRSAPILCIKEPFLMTQGGYLAAAFPNSKLLHMVRDGRAVSNSLVSRNLEFPPFSPTDHRQNLGAWAKLASGMDLICKTIGTTRCRTVRYEDLVQDTETVMKKIVDWLGLEWTPEILSHTAKMSEIQVSSLETTSDQVNRPVYQDALQAWRNNIPKKILDDHELYGEVLATFGYTL